MQCAAKYGHLRIVVLLLEFGAQIDHQDKVGHLGSLDIVTMFDVVGIMLQYGCTAVVLATRARQTHVVECLIQKGANLDLQEKVYFLMSTPSLHGCYSCGCRCCRSMACVLC